MKYGNPTLVRQPLWVSLASDKDVKFLIKPLSYAQVYGLNEYYYLKDKLDNLSNFKPYDTLEQSIIEVKGTIGFNSIEQVLVALSQEDKNFLEYTLYSISSLTNEQLSNIDELINLITEPKLQEPTYNCEKCKSIPGMQQARNCPLIEINNPAKFKLKISNKVYTKCPMSSIDNFVANQIIQSHNFLALNSLPLSGGIEEQSVWFVIVAQKYKSRINELKIQNQS